MKLWILLGALNGFMAVGFGAFAAHGLKARATPTDLAAFNTGADYHMHHALALLAVGWLAAQAPSPLVTMAGWAFALGILLFSGSLYHLGLTGSRSLVLVTPMGGTAFLIGWLCLAIAAYRLA
ncbi:MAG: DUF423 domain-containing protein [Alphaproteobacteria bacterium]|nr:DUF423 domain-containing protein [Alphaproteobacteria bacterium]MBO6627445.1 DUF423 domain-containing protein [Alphaproteobacteria bacterium]MDF1627084.1 DUF423 domain-containing protein [Parvibaculaceae bacterium]|tara:strand:- start:719 stop:1087 length:369 start_codon:yes stop_codon:yes gene_type:complete